MTPIVQLIATSIAPGTWQVHDGNGCGHHPVLRAGRGVRRRRRTTSTTRPPGAITPFFLSISLIIRHTAEVHDQVADLLRQLRRLQDLQVSIEVRFITVQDNFFEQIGVDFDFQIQSDAIGKHTTFAAVNPSQSLFPITGRARAACSPARAPRGTTGGSDRRRHDRRRHDAAARPAAATGGGRPAAARPAAAAAARPAAAARAAAAASGGHRRRHERRRDRRRRRGRQRPPRRPRSTSSTRSATTPTATARRSSWAPRAAGIGNFSPNLDIPFTEHSGQPDRPELRQQLQPNARGDVRHRLPQRPGGLPVPHGRPGRHAVQRAVGPQGHHVQRCRGHDHQRHAPVLRLLADADHRPRCGGLHAERRRRSTAA